MKKVLFVLALLLIPAITFAGTATSRWDVTIGGFVNAEFGYSDQLRGWTNIIPYRESKTAKSYGDEYGTFFSSVALTRFNFLIKGPDAWGMKTSAFMEGDFVGTSGRIETSGGFRLRHAFLKMSGSTMDLTVGQTSQVFGSLTGTAQALLAVLPWFDSALPVGAGRMPQITAEWALTKSFKALLGVFVNDNPVGATGTLGGDIDFYTMGTPYVHARLKYENDITGKIGRDVFTFLVDGFYGKDKRVSTNPTAYAAPSTTTAAARFYSKKTDSWGAHSSILIPILREKQNNKQGALAISGFGFAMQNPGDQGIPPITFSPGSQTPYMRGDGKWASLLITGWGAQMYTYFTNNLLFTANYSDVSAKMSNRYAAANVNDLKNRKSFVFILAYDPNPAVRFTLDWETNRAEFAGYGAGTMAGTGKKGKVNVFRLGAFYFF